MKKLSSLPGNLAKLREDSFFWFLLMGYFP